MHVRWTRIFERQRVESGRQSNGPQNMFMSYPLGPMIGLPKGLRIHYLFRSGKRTFKRESEGDAIIEESNRIECCWFIYNTPS